MKEKAYNYYVDMVEFGKRVKTVRKEHGISMKEMEDFFGLSPQALYKWERGTAFPEVQNLYALSRFLGVSVDSLLGGSHSQTAA